MNARRVQLVAITIDCDDVDVLANFYGAAFDAEITHRDNLGAWVHLPGGLILLPRFVEHFVRPSWPSNEIPIQMHLELAVDDVASTERWLYQLGATRAAVQPAAESRTMVMLDPAGHPFCIYTGTNKQLGPDSELKRHST